MQGGGGGGAGTAERAPWGLSKFVAAETNLESSFSQRGSLAACEGAVEGDRVGGLGA